MLYLNQRDLLEAAGLPELLDGMERALRLYEDGDFLMPPRMHVDHHENTLLLMPCFTRDSFATKLVSLFPGNPRAGLPFLNGLVVLNDVHTGMPLAILDGPVLTALRTAAVAGVGLRHLASPDMHSFGLVGAGVQGFHQVCLAAAARPLRDVYLYDCDRDASDRLAAALSHKLPALAVHPTASIRELLAHSEAVTTATMAQTPVLPDDADLLRGKHITAIGSYQRHVREIPRALYGLVDTVHIDTRDALSETGDIIYPLEQGWITQDQIRTLGRRLMESADVDAPREQTTFFKSVGMALFDVTAARLIYDRALSLGLGQPLER
jgi:ornithine cyclodeaminase